MQSISLFVSLLLVLAFDDALGFAPAPKGGVVSQRFMVPRYDGQTQRWEERLPEEEESAGYPPIGSLIRQGPLPFLQRLKEPDMYNQAVLKMMAERDMDRKEAQGNMDAYLGNPNDWAVQKIEENKGAAKFDYANVNMEPKSLALTGIWASVVLTVVTRSIYLMSVGCDDICREFHI
jgi:hypothetical protein